MVSTDYEWLHGVESCHSQAARSVIVTPACIKDNRVPIWPRELTRQEAAADRDIIGIDALTPRAFLAREGEDT